LDRKVSYIGAVLASAGVLIFALGMYGVDNSDYYDEESGSYPSMEYQLNEGIQNYGFFMYIAGLGVFFPGLYLDHRQFLYYFYYPYNPYQMQYPYLPPK
jgi:hypothetical protein